jgi:hypothetical protein
MRIRKSYVIVSLIAAFSGLSLPMAFGAILQSGAVVIDYKRLADSIQNTAQQARIAADTAQRYAKMVLNNTKFKKPDSISTQNTYSFPEQYNGWKKKKYYNGWNPQELDDTTHKFKTGILEDMRKKSLNTQRQILVAQQRAQKRRKANILLAKTPTKGNLSEKQKKNQLKINLALEKIDEAKITATELLNIINNEENYKFLQAYEREKAKLLSMKPYDPYHPTEEDKKTSKSKSENFGFIRYKE